eukprot:42861-Eustigmatos_ZCMA.PRE.1
MEGSFRDQVTSHRHRCGCVHDSHVSLPDTSCVVHLCLCAIRVYAGKTHALDCLGGARERQEVI